MLIETNVQADAFNLEQMLSNSEAIVEVVSSPLPPTTPNYSELSILSDQIPANNSIYLSKAFIEIFQVPVAIVAILSVCYGAVSMVAVVGNVCVLWVVVSRRRMRSVTNYFIGNLALADIVIGLFAVPFQFQAALLQKWLLPAFLCAFCPFIQVLSVNVSVFTLSAIAFDRYRAVFSPFNRRGTSKLSAKLIILGIWLLSGLAAAPYGIAFRVTMAYDPITGDNTRPFCTNIRVPMEVWAIYHYALVILQYFLPLCLISYAYGRMALRLRNNGGARAARDEAVLRNKRKVIKMLSIVVALFAVCWLPFQTYNVLQEVMPKINEYKYINVIWFCAHWLAMSNSCYNPFIYAIYNERFKKEFATQFLCRKHRPRHTFDSDTALFSMPTSSMKNRSLIVENVLGDLERYLEQKEVPVNNSSQVFLPCENDRVDPPNIVPQLQ